MVDGREALVEWRRQVIAARLNWLDLQKQYGRDDRELGRLAREEAADCLKHERACTQLIEVIDGKRAASGELQGDKHGYLTHRIPSELAQAFSFCRGVADYGLLAAGGA